SISIRLFEALQNRPSLILAAIVHEKELARRRLLDELTKSVGLQSGCLIEAGHHDRRFRHYELISSRFGGRAGFSNTLRPGRCG
ncbi:MAG: hypothetical protein VXZ53_18750, partial [Planctomycetota bacterium]|nr:hypothetical protein [Planctomycetota bacterium]